ncbi:MAG TPA: hypothetical protein VFK32_02520 [Tepidiformaceae bacterium]|nr:hypothetical protein [Tepidiformaceae bacterium]
MYLRTGLLLLLLVLLVATGWGVADIAHDRATAAPKTFRVRVPQVSRGSAAVPAPTIGTGDRDVWVSVDIDANELSLQSGGLTDVKIIATADTHLPGPFDPPRTVTGTVQVFVVHPVDSAGCVWNRVFANPNFTMTISQPTGMGLSVLIYFAGPEWHYDVVCPAPSGGSVEVRVPAFGEQSLTGELGFAFPGRAGPNGFLVQTPVFSGSPSCIKREAIEQGTHILADATVTVWVYEPPCLLPLPGP